MLWFYFCKCRPTQKIHENVFTMRISTYTVYMYWTLTPIHQVVKYWPEKNVSGFIVWKYLLRRDDPVSHHLPQWDNRPVVACTFTRWAHGFVCFRTLLTRLIQSPAPWTSEGKKTIKKLGLTMQVHKHHHESYTHTQWLYHSDTVCYCDKQIYWHNYTILDSYPRSGNFCL